MKILLDTHVILWVLTDDARLSDQARKLIADPENLICYSAASVWEIAGVRGTGSLTHTHVRVKEPAPLLICLT